MKVARCVSCLRTRETNDGLCCDCLAGQLIAVKLQVAANACRLTDGVTLEVEDLAPQSLEGFAYYAEPEGFAPPLCAVFRLRLLARRGDFCLGNVALPLDGVKVLSATATFVHHHTQALPGEMLPDAIAHAIEFTVMDEVSAGETFRLLNVLPPSVTRLLAALDVDPAAVVALREQP